MSRIKQYQEAIDSLQLLEKEPLIFMSEDVYEYVALDISPNFVYLAAGGLYSDNIAIWDIKQQKQIIVIGTESNEDLGQIQFSNDSVFLAACGSSGEIKIWETSSFVKKPVLLKGHEQRVWRISFFNHPLNHLLCSSSSDATVRVWNIFKKELISTLLGHGSQAVYGVSISPKNDLILSSGVDGKAIIWYTKRNLQLKTTIIDSQFFCVQFPQHTQCFYASSGIDDYVRLFTRGKIIRKIENTEHWKWLIEFSRNGTILAISSISSITFWDVSQGKKIKSIANEYYTYPSFRFRYFDRGGLVTAHKHMIKLWIQ